MKTNYHTHTTWCDGKNSPRQMVEAALDKKFNELGFSSHAMLPKGTLDWVLNERSLSEYVKEIHALKMEFKDQIKILCGVEADYIRGMANPDRGTFAAYQLDYIIGSVHFVVADDGTPVAVDDTPEILSAGIRDHFDGNVEKYVRAYFEQQREMIKGFDFEVIAHPDLVRKFNQRHPFFDESAPWYREELVKMADAIAASGKLCEVNTGAISRGWLDEAYPSASFYELLRARGVKFILSSDAHSADGLDCAFDRFGGDKYEEL